MPPCYAYEDIDLGALKHTGHDVYREAKYEGKHVVFKRNKRGKPELSRFEVAFNGLAARFLQKGLTSPQVLVKNKDQQIEGLASNHLMYDVLAKEGLTKAFYTLDKKNPEVFMQPVQAKSAEDIPLYFFNQFQPGYFAKLYAMEQQGLLSFDMASLMSVLTTAYSLEEDDLHKGNLGFYVVVRNNKPCVVFLKIDPDLMLADSLMSYMGARFLNWRLDDYAFEVTARDLKDFPKLSDSNNYYWPTTERYLTLPSARKKVHLDPDDREAYAHIGQRPDVQGLKWGDLYKHTLIPEAVTAESLTVSFDKNQPWDRAQIAMITHAVVARQARERCVLFSIPEFRDYVSQLDTTQETALLNEIFDGIEEPIRQEQETALKKIIAEHKQLCATVDLKDTPLHLAIRLGDYRYDETWHSYGKFANVANAQGQYPLDLALQQAATPAAGDVRKDGLQIAKDLLSRGAHKTPSYEALDADSQANILKHQFPCAYQNRAKLATDSESLITVLRDLGEDNRYTLKMKKDITLTCMKAFIAANGASPNFASVLAEVHQALNGKDNEPPRPELQFIRQLRSRLWIVRQIRGLFGNSSTLLNINRLIDEALVSVKSPEKSGFFAKTFQFVLASKSDIDHAEECYTECVKGI